MNLKGMVKNAMADTEVYCCGQYCPPGEDCENCQCIDNRIYEKNTYSCWETFLTVSCEWGCCIEAYKSVNGSREECDLGNELEFCDEGECDATAPEDECRKGYHTDCSGECQ